jgi:hypothetical protein
MLSHSCSLLPVFGRCEACGLTSSIHQYVTAAMIPAGSSLLSGHIGERVTHATRSWPGHLHETAQKCGPPAAKVCYYLLPMRGHRLAVALSILVIVSGAVGRFSSAVMGSVLAHCCCGVHNAAEPCHCPDCPSTHSPAEDTAASAPPRTAQRPSQQPSQQPSINRCSLERVAAILAQVAQTAATSVKGLAAPRRFTILEATLLPLPAPSPAAARLERPPPTT